VLLCCRPLAGTRRRGATPEQDVALEEELLADEKECAEHVMLVDLGRNDVGKVRVQGGQAWVVDMVQERGHTLVLPSHLALCDGLPHLQVSCAGSVKVEKLMEVERYSHVMHISSTGTAGGTAAGSAREPMVLNLQNHSVLAHML